MESAILTFLLYILFAGNTTYFLGRSLYTHGEPFLASIFMDRPEIVQPLNKVLLIGFYLVNLGFVLLFLTQQKEKLSDFTACIEFLSLKLGIVYLVLGCMHLLNIFIFITLEKKLYKSNAKQ